MNYKRILMVCIVAAAVAVGIAAAPDDGVEFKDSSRDQWRIKAGGAFNFGLHSRIGARGGRAIELVPQFSGTTYGSREEAEARINGTASGLNGVRMYENGFVNPHDNADIDGETTNFRGFPRAGQLIDESRGIMTLHGDRQYAGEVRSTYGSSQFDSDCERFWSPGISIAVERELYADTENHWGIDLSFGASYFTRDNFFKNRGGLVRRTDEYNVYHLAHEYDVSDMRDWTGSYQYNDDGSYGSGSLTWNGTDDLIGPILRYNKVDMISVLDSTERQVHTLSYSMRGDYDEVEMVLGLQPYYQPYDWLRLYGTLGVAVSYVRVGYDDRFYADGELVAGGRHHDDDWDVYGVGGLGALLSYERYFFGADVLARFLHDDVEIESKYVRGTLSRGSWVLRVFLGLTF